MMTEYDTPPSDRSDQSCDCCGSDTRRASTTDTTADRWLGDADPLKAALPNDLRKGLERLLGEESIDTLGDWIGRVRRGVGGGSIQIDDLCHADSETPHRGTVGGETYHFQCFYDAVVLAALTEDPVDIRTESPGGTRIEAQAEGTDVLRVSPAEAVFSFGVEAAVDPPTGTGPTHADVYAAVCPYVRAFPDRNAYEQWAAVTDAATIGLPLAGATEIANALVE